MLCELVVYHSKCVCVYVCHMPCVITLSLLKLLNISSNFLLPYSPIIFHRFLVTSSHNFNILGTLDGGGLDLTCVVPRTRTQFGDRSFAVAGPRVWNSLPAPLRDTNGIYSFRKQLKMHLFSGGCRTY